MADIPVSSYPIDHLYKLIGTEFSFFTAKVRAYLQWKDVPFCEVLATPDVYKQVIRPCTGTTIIPVLVLPGSDNKPWAIQDSKDIMNHIHAHFPTPSLRMPNTQPCLVFMDMLAELVADEWLSLPTMQHRWGSEDVRPSYDFEFGSTMGKASPEQRLKNGAKAGKRFVSMLPVLGVTSRTIPVLDAQFDALVAALNTHLTTHDFVLGCPHPTLADFALYGALYSGTFRDPVRGPLLKLRAPYVSEWIERLGMRLHARGPQRAILATSETGVRFVRPRMEHHIDVNSVPPSAEAWLAILLADFLPQMVTTAHAFRKAAANASSEPLPRAIGFHEFTLRWPSSSGTSSAEPVKDKRATNLHSIWMVQRIADMVYNEHSEQCSAWLRRSFGEESEVCWKEIVDALHGVRVERVGASIRVRSESRNAKL